jgi:hypothetical protein
MRHICARVLAVVAFGGLLSSQAIPRRSPRSRDLPSHASKRTDLRRMDGCVVAGSLCLRLRPEATR